MAHIKVVRRSLRPEEWTDMRFCWLKRYIYDLSEEITSVTVREAHQVAENRYEYYDETPRELKKGDLYFSPDGSAFIKADIEIPESMQGKEVYFCLKTSAEMIVRCNGFYLGGIDPNRERIAVTPYIHDSKLHFEIEAYNRSKPDDERNPEVLATRGCRQIFEGAYLKTLNNTVQSLVYDIELLLDIAKSDLFNEGFRELVNKELNNALNLIDFDAFRTEDAAAAAEYINKKIFQNKTYRGNGNVALIAHSHLDIAYYWRRIHSVQKNLRTVLIQLRLMDKYPDFRYTHTQAFTYETLEKYYPEVFEELKEKIASGRFEPVGAMYIESDCNIPSAESLIRQCLYGQSYFRDKFGLTVNSCWLPDVFGNSWILPQILKKSGVDYFVSNKMSTWNDTNRFPHNNFIWRGIDGTEVFACVPPTHFITWNMPSQIQENWEAYQEKNNGGQTLNMFGYGDGGSGATEEMIELMHRFDKVSVMPKTEHMSAKDYLEKNFKNNGSLECWDGELYLEMHRGTFTTKSELKRFNRMLENKFRNAELVSSIRRLDGEDYPAEEIRALYKKFLVNQFHDILPGSHITPVYRDAVADYTEINEALDRIIGSGKGNFNTLSFDRQNITFVEDENGNDIREGKKGFWRMPCEGALTCIDFEKASDDTSWIHIDGLNIETPYYSIKFASDGSFESLFDKKLNREWTQGDFNKLRIFDDRPGNYDAWDILPNYTDRQFEIKISEPLHFVCADGECARFETVLSTEKSKWKLIIRIFRSSRAIEVENIVDWNEKHRLAKMYFSCNVLTRELVSDTSAGFIKRDTHRNTTWQKAKFEVCQHKWSDMGETDGGIAIINEGKYGIGAYRNEMSLSLLRATIRPDPTSDIGRHNFSYMIYPHADDFIKAGINRLALEYNAPLIKSDLTLERSFSPLLLQSVKLSEDGKYIVYRLSEQNGARGKLPLGKAYSVMNMLEDVIAETDLIEYGPFEIITIAEKL
ncbi:MAG: alpha-mannosidase [Ruminococcaceae bacterium]|nr:alpha-mannosidase [Oscillospiraceae bacterium]